MNRRLRDRIWRRGARPDVVELDVSPGLPERDVERVRTILIDLLGRHDTMTQRAETESVAHAYRTLSDDGRRNFLQMLAREFWIDDAVVDDAIDAMRRGGDRRVHGRALRDALTPKTEQLLRLFTALDDGVKFLVDLRADALRLADGDAQLVEIGRELRVHCATLFDAGFLTLARITWDAPASLLEKLMQYEAVHPIESWSDLKNRLGSDRRCYAFFHPMMGNEPLVFVEIALTHGVAEELPPLLDTRVPDLDVADADTAVFYSISNCQPGLAGVNLGTVLIKQVVDELREDLPQLKNFVTLSPIPGFGAWLHHELRAATLSDRERELLPAEPWRTLERLGDPEWAFDEAVGPALLALCARYLTTAPEGRALDPVANFHLSNGAAIERINSLADPSPSGHERSLGLMVNYRYEPELIPERAEAYAATGEIVASPLVRDLLT
ncbi:MAG TPA: malonyl-CoA decarboxylase family protein [Acidimicrobiia bacterium]|nr:malonyl-CoA decarboxylase family protein [Acidimicrobiia bacterium]